MKPYPQSFITHIGELGKSLVLYQKTLMWPFLDQEFLAMWLVIAHSITIRRAMLPTCKLQLLPFFFFTFFVNFVLLIIWVLLLIKSSLSSYYFPMIVLAIPIALRQTAEGTQSNGNSAWRIWKPQSSAGNVRWKPLTK